MTFWCAAGCWCSGGRPMPAPAHRRTVVVGRGHDSHLTMIDSLHTYCGRIWTADSQDPLVTCRQCRAASAAGRHPRIDLP